MALQHSFSGKRILITGGGQGIGRQLVQRFYDDGATVFTIDKNPETIKELKKALPNVTAEIADLSDWDGTRKVVESFGVIDHLVNNAGIFISQPFLDVSKDAFTAQIGVNLGAMINVSQVVAKGLIGAGRGGSIVNVASIASKQGNSLGGTVYAATKAGVANLTKSMAIELGPHNIRVNAVSPGMVDTPLLQKTLDDNDQYMDAAMQRCVIKRFIKPNDIADLVAFLLSPLSAMIAGDNILIDAGLLTS